MREARGLSSRMRWEEISSHMCPGFPEQVHPGPPRPSLLGSGTGRLWSSRRQSAYKAKVILEGGEAKAVWRVIAPQYGEQSHLYLSSIVSEGHVRFVCLPP